METKEKKFMNRFQQSPQLKKLVRKENKCAKYGKTEENNGKKAC